MKKLLTILSLFISNYLIAQPVISANPSSTIVVSAGGSGTVTLSATGTGVCTWTKYYDITQPINTSTWEKSAPPFDNATLTPSGNNNTTCTITGMKQGRWYYSVTNSSGTAYITIDVDAFSAPTNSTLFSNSNTVSSGYSVPSFADYASYVNYNDRRQDSLAYIGTTGDNNFSLSNGQQHYIFRDALNMGMVDNRMGKWYFSVRDGLPSHNGNGGFSTHAYGTTTFREEYSTGKTYIFEYKGYVDTKLSSLGISQPNINNNNIFFFENHSLNNASGDVCSSCSPSLSLIYCPSDGTIRTYESLTGGSSTGINGTGAHSTSIPGDTWFAGNAYGNNWNGPVITNADSLYNQAHTFRMTVREGPSGSGAFYKVEMDGKQVYLRTTGQVGQTANNDYPIFGEIYDYNAQLTSPNNSSRHRQISAVMERYGTYIINANNPPIVNAGPAQTLSSGTSSAILDGSYSRDDGGYIASLTWSKVSGPNNPTFGSQGSYTTTVNGLVNGVYIFKLQATDNNNNTSTGTVTVNVGTGSGPTAPSIVINSGSSPFPSGTTSVSLTATSSASAGISHYNWSYTGTAGASFSDSTSSTTNITGLSDGGSYSIQVYATDNNGVTSAITNLNISVNSSGQSSLLTGIVSYWKLDEGSGTSAADAVGSNTGTNTSATVGVTGKINTAYSFNGSSSKVDMNVNSSLQPTTGSISVWVKLNSLSSEQVIVSNGNVSSDTYGVTLEYNHADNGFNWEVANGSGHQYGTISGTITTGVWYNIILTWNGFYVNTYLNGVGNQIAQTQAAAYSNNHFVLGYNYATNSFYLNGTIDEVGLWNRVLLPGEVSTLYNNGRGLIYPFNTPFNTLASSSWFF